MFKFENVNISIARVLARSGMTNIYCTCSDSTIVCEH